MSSKSTTARALKDQRHRECYAEQVYRVFESGIVGSVIRPFEDLGDDLRTPGERDEGGEGGGA